MFCWIRHRNDQNKTPSDWFVRVMSKNNNAIDWFVINILKITAVLNQLIVDSSFMHAKDVYRHVYQFFLVMNAIEVVYR